MEGRTTHDECECPVCQEDYVHPKLLRCGHIICRQCVLTWLETGGQQNGCPLCRADIFPQDKDFSEILDLATMLDSLPTDASMISMVECKQLLKGDHVCCVCDDNTSASTVCMDCNIKLCQSCSNSHKKFPTFREHIMEELNTLTPEKLAALRKSFCEIHKERPAEFYCLRHQSLVCVLCLSSNHRACRTITVSDFANSERQELKKQCENLRSIKTSLEEQMVLLKQRLHDVQSHTTRRKNEIKAKCNRLKQSVDRQCQDLQRRVEAVAEIIESKINTENSTLKEHHTSVAAHVFVADRLLTTAANGPLVISLPSVKASMSALESQNAELHPIKEHDVWFDSEMLNRLERAVHEFEKMVATEVKVKKYQVQYDYNPQDIDELELKVGSIVEIHNKVTEGWWLGSACGKTGLFPSNCVQMLEEDEDEDENKDEGNIDEAREAVQTICSGDYPTVTDSEDESNQLILEDTLKDIKQRLDEMLDVPESDVCQIEECIEVLMKLYYEHHEQRTTLADAVYYHGYPIVLAKLLKKLSAMEFSDDVWSLVESTYSVLWNYSDSGDKLAKGLADAGIVSILTSNLSCKKYIKALDDENVYYLLEASINTLHNIARWPEVKYHFKKCKTHEAMKPFLTLDGTKYISLKVSATVTSVYIAISEGILKRIADKDVINNIVRWLENAMESDDDTFECLAPYEFVQALVKLAESDANKLKIVEAGALPLLLNLLQQDDVKGQAMGAKCLWTLCFNLKARQQIIEFPEIIEILEMLTESEFPDVRINAAFALWAIKDDGCF